MKQANELRPVLQKTNILDKQQVSGKVLELVQKKSLTTGTAKGKLYSVMFKPQLLQQTLQLAAESSTVY